MTESQVLDEIFNTFKWYVGIVTDKYAYILKKRYKEGKLSQETIDMIIRESGYVVSQDKVYTRPT